MATLKNLFVRLRVSASDRGVHGVARNMHAAADRADRLDDTLRRGVNPSIRQFGRDGNVHVGRVTAATHRLGRALADAHLRARRLRLAAVEAGERARRSHLRAARATDQFRKAMIGAERANAAATRAARDHEKAQLAVMAANLAQAKAADLAAERTRRLAHAHRRTDRTGRRVVAVLGRMVKVLSLVGAGAGAFSLLAGGVASAIVPVLSLSAALAPLGGLIATLPGLIALTVSAFAVFKLATLGIGAAFRAAFGEAKAFEKALEKLSPAAKDFAREFRAIIPALKNTLQDAFFRDLRGEIRQTVAALAPIKPLLVGIAAEMSRVVKSFLDWVQARTTINRLAVILGNLKAILHDLRTTALGPLLNGFLDLGVVGSSFFRALTPSIAAAAARFGEFLSRAAASGRALEWMNAALMVLKQLGAIVGDVAGLFRGLFRAMRESGASALGIFGQFLEAANEWANSVEGQRILVTIFKALRDIGSSVVTIFKAFGSAIADIAPHIANIVKALAPGVSAAIKALGRALAAMGPGLTVFAEQLAQAFADPTLQGGLLALGKGLGEMFVALSPLLPIIAKLAGIMAKSLGAQLSSIAALLKPVIAALAESLRPVLVSISRAITLLAPLIPPVAAAFGKVAAAVLKELLPPILNLIPALIEALVPAFVELAYAVLPLLPTLTDLAVIFVRELLPAILPILPQLVQLATFITQVGVVLLALVRTVKPALKAIVAIFQWMFNMLIGNSIVPDMIRGLRTWFMRGGQWIISAISTVGRLPGMFANWLAGVVRNVAAGLTNVVRKAHALPGRIGNALSGVYNQLYGIGRDVVIGLWNGIVSLWNWVVRKVRSLFGGLINWAKRILGIGSPSKIFANIGKNVAQSMAQGIEKSAGMVEKAAGKLAVSPTLAVRGAMAPAYAGASTGSSGGRGGLTVGDIHLTVRGIVDFRKPDQAARQVLKEIREGIRDLDRESK